jgi:hypothetical protein
MAANDLEITVLPNGVYRITTDKFDGPVHLRAHQMITFIQEQLGGTVEIVARKGATHVHEGEHEHEHVGGKK